MKTMKNSRKMSRDLQAFPPEYVIFRHSRKLITTRAVGSFVEYEAPNNTLVRFVCGFARGRMANEKYYQRNLFWENILTSDPCMR